MTPSSSADWTLIERYLAGECTAEERARVGEWVAESPEHAEMLRSLGSAWVAWSETGHRVFDQYDADVAWQAMDVRATPARRLSVQMERASASRRITAWWVTGVAAAAVLIVGGLVLHEWPRFGGAPARDYATAPGQRLSVRLADGTEVILGPQSHVRVDAGYGQRTRKLMLDGEAYFRVVHNEVHPFAVHARRALVTDVGTEFDIRAYHEDPAVRVAVAEGAVVVKRGDGGRVGDPPLRGGDVADITDTGIVITRHADISHLITWMQNGLSFEDKPFRDVLQDISRTFGVTITLADTSLAQARVTAAFAGQPLDFVLNVVTRVVGGRYERDGQRIVVRKGLNTTQTRPSTPPPLVTARVGGRDNN